MTRLEFKRVFEGFLEAAARSADRYLGYHVPRNFRILLHGAGHPGELMAPSAAADALHLGEDEFYLIIDLGVADVGEDFTTIFVRPSGRPPGPWEKTWNTPHGAGPFRHLGPEAAIRASAPSAENRLRVYQLYPPFTGEYQKHFRFLVDAYGCRVVGTGEDVRSAFVTYANATTGVDVAFLPRENSVSVALTRLVHGQVLPYRLHPSHWLYLHELLAARAPSENLATKAHGDPVTGADLDHLLARYADALRLYADDILRGNFSLFDELVVRRMSDHERRLQHSKQ